jgi:hypothetical protein
LCIDLEGGRATRIDTSTPDGCYLAEWFRSFGREDAYDVSHINLGLIPLSVLNLDNEAVHFAAGGVVSAFGIRQFGWSMEDIMPKTRPNHLDWWMANASYYIDDIPILKDGQFTADSGLAFDASELTG